jgi:hypothetical protein
LNPQNIFGEISKQSSITRNARTPPIIKMKITEKLDDKNYNFENFLNKSYVKYEGQSKKEFEKN